MKLLAVTALLGLAAARNVNVEWQNFKRTHNKLYSPMQDERRFTIFKQNLDFIERHNAAYTQGLESYTVGINEFADLTNSEFHSHRLGLQQTASLGIRRNYQCPVNFKSNGNTATSVDWTTTSNPKKTVAVTAVKDQGQCGSCWSFGTTGTFEGQECIAGNYNCKTWAGASEQQLCDCGGKGNSDIGNYYDNGCGGGWIDNGLYYIQQTGFIDSESSYPYTSGKSGVTGTCKATTSNSVGTESNCGATAKNSESELQQAISQVGPVGIAIDAGGIGFQLYSGGVYVSNTCSSSSLNHAVLAAGYGTEGGQDYWLVKNSWGTAWGMNGYIQMARNRNNQCGVAATPAYSIL